MDAQTRLGVTRTLDGPRDRQAGERVHGGVNLVPVEAAALTRRDCRAVAHDASVSLWPLTLGTVLRQEPLAVRVRGKVGAVDRDVLAHAGVRVARTVKHRADARIEQILPSADRNDQSMPTVAS